MYPIASLSVLILDTLVSQGTFGIFSRSDENAELILWVRLRSFLLAEFRFLTGGRRVRFPIKQVVAVVV